jgi:hypothetical protein
MNDCFQDLANAIILQAVHDYRKALKILKRYPRCEAALIEKKRDEEFFTSEWYSHLTKVDGRRLMKRLQEEV